MQLTSRRESVTVFTVTVLRNHLEKISSAGCRFSIHKVHSDRVSVRADYVLSRRLRNRGVKMSLSPILFREFTGRGVRPLLDTRRCVDIIDSHPFPNDGKGWGTDVIGWLDRKGQTASPRLFGVHQFRQFGLGLAPIRFWSVAVSVARLVNLVGAGSYLVFREVAR